MCTVLTDSDYTTQEYLERVRHTCPPFLSSADLAISCLVYLSLDGVRELPKNPFLKYAAQGWGEHSCGFDNCPNITKYAVGLLSDTAKVEMVGNVARPNGWPLLGASGLHLCSCFGLTHIAERLPSYGQHINLRDWRGRVPLHYAARFGQQLMTKLLLETGKVDVDAGDKYEQTPLSWAAENGHDRVVELLLETGKVDVNSRDRDHGRTPLSWAAENGHDGVVKLLLETGKVDVDSRDIRKTGNSF